MREEFFQRYEARMTQKTYIFDGVAELIAEIQARGLQWGIVTNKVTYLTLPIVEFLDLTRDSAVLVCGDTTAHAKPHPLPLQHAAREAGFSVDRCVYVGDDLRDIQAAHAAGMPAVAAAYGYVGEDENLTTWEAEACANTPADLWAAIQPLLPRDLR